MTAYDVITMGRVGVDLYPLQSGARLDEVETFARFLGGSATNVAVAAARLGRRAAVVTRTGADPFGRFVRRALAEYGVDARFVADVPGLPTPVTFCELFPPDDFPLYFYRFPKAPDLEIRADELDIPAIEAAGVLWATVTGLCAEPSTTATLAALGARRSTRPAGPPCSATSTGSTRWRPRPASGRSCTRTWGRWWSAPTRSSASWTARPSRCAWTPATC
jgi:5-dehydro-2-deoxygluconokinase